jgi:hypothetical protein
VRAFRPVAQEKLPDKPTAAEGTKKATSGGSKIHLALPLSSIVCYTNLLVPHRLPFYISQWY